MAGIRRALIFLGIVSLVELVMAMSLGGIGSAAAQQSMWTFIGDVIGRLLLGGIPGYLAFYAVYRARQSAGSTGWWIALAVIPGLWLLLGTAASGLWVVGYAVLGAVLGYWRHGSGKSGQTATA